MPEIKPPTNMLGKANPDFPDPAVKRDYLTLNIEQPKVEEPKVEPAPAPTPLPRIKPPEPEPLMTITEGLDPKPDCVYRERIPHKRGYAECALWVAVYADGSLGFSLDFHASTERRITAANAKKVMMSWLMGRGSYDFHNLRLHWSDEIMGVYVRHAPFTTTYRSESTVIRQNTAEKHRHTIETILANVNARK